MKIIISICADILHVLKIFIICKYCLVLNEKRDNKYRYHISMLITVMMSVFLYFSENIHIKFFLFIFYILVMVYICYSERLIKIIIVGIWTLLVTELINMIFLLTIETANTALNIDASVVNDLMAELGSFFIVLLACFLLRKIDKNGLKNVNIKYLILISGVIVSDLFIMSMMVRITLREVSVKNKVIYTTVFLLISLGIYIQIVAILLLVVSRNIYKEKELIIKQCLEDQVIYYEYLNEREKGTKKFRHDIRSHLYYLYTIKQEGNNEKFNEYLNDIIDCVDKLGHKIDVGNDIVNALLNKAYSEAVKNNIEMTVKGHFPDVCKIPVYDLCTIFFNLLNNSVEAAKDASVKEMWVICQYDSNEIILEVGNYYSGIIDNSDNIIYSSKVKNDFHGWGLENVRDSVKKCNGLMDIECNDNKFIVSVTLNNEEAKLD